jgi:uncharacterized membrane protein
VVHLISHDLVQVWVAFNLNPHGKSTFDPFPFALLTMIVSLESIFLSLFILMSQNRSGMQADQRNHLDLQINLLSEDEYTKTLQMLKAICEHHKLSIGNDPEVEAMGRRTEIKEVLSELQENLPIDEDPLAAVSWWRKEREFCVRAVRPTRKVSLLGG